MSEPERTLEQVIEAARKLIATQLVGVLTTVDQNHTPHSRWMLGAVEGEGMTTLRSLSARGAPKLDHLDHNDQVCWIFSDSHHDEVVTLTGTMIRLESPNMAEHAWQGLAKAAEKYSMNLLSEAENLWFVGLETTVNEIQYMAPSKGLTHPVTFTLS